jgi:hypothetical protein
MASHQRRRGQGDDQMVGETGLGQTEYPSTRIDNEDDNELIR